MATQLFFRNEICPGIHLGTNTLNLRGTNGLWLPVLLGTTRGSGVTSKFINSITGPTPGIELADNTTQVIFEWYTPPLAATATISGTITLNLWGAENTMNDNMAINAYVDRVDAQGNIVSRIATSARVTELALTTSSVNNFTVAPTSTTVLKGERIRVVVFFDDVGTMAVGGAGFFYWSGVTAAASGDSYISFTETLTFLTTEPSGTILYLTDTAGPAVSAAVEKEAWTTRGTLQQSAQITTVAGWTAPIQWTTTTSSGLVVEWYTKPLTAFTLSGLVRFNLWSTITSAGGGIRAEIAICDSDGSNVVVWSAGSLVDSATPGGTFGSGTSTSGAVQGSASAVIKAWLVGADTAVTNGQRLRFRFFTDDTSNAPMTVGQTAIFYYASQTVGAVGDTWVQLPQSVTLFSLNPTPATYTATAAAQAPTIPKSQTITPSTYTATAAAQAPTITAAQALTLTPATYPTGTERQGTDNLLSLAVQSNTNGDWVLNNASPYTPLGTGNAVSQETTNIHLGGAAIKLVGTSTAGGSLRTSATVGSSFYVPALSTDTYKMRCYARLGPGNAAANVRLGVGFAGYTGALAANGGGSSGSIVLTNAYTLIAEFSSITQANNAWAQPVLIMTGTDVSTYHEILVDTVLVKVNTSITDIYPSSTVGQPQAPVVKTTTTITPGVYTATAAAQAPTLSTSATISPSTYVATASAQAATPTTVTIRSATISSDWGRYRSALILVGTDNNASTPDASALDVASDIEIVAHAMATDWTRTTIQTLVAHWADTGNQRGWIFRITTTGFLQLLVSSTGANFPQCTSTVAVPFTDGTWGWLKVTRRRSDGLVQFFTAPDQAQEPATWTQLGTNVTNSLSGSPLWASTAPLQVGAHELLELFVGQVAQAIVRDGIGGPTVASPDFTNPLQWPGYVDSQGNPWTVNGTGWSFAPSVSSQEGWTGTARALQEHPATISTNWGTWSAAAAAIPLVTGTIADNWGSWTATAAGGVSRSTTITPTTYVATAAAQAATPSTTINWPATIATNWGTWTGTATAQPIQRNATISTIWQSLGHEQRMLGNNTAPNTPYTQAGLVALGFTVNADGLISRYRYYNNDGSPHTLSLWNTLTGLVYSTGDDSPGGVTGWRTVSPQTPTSPVPVYAGVEYRISVTTNGVAQLFSASNPPASLSPALTIVSAYTNTSGAYPTAAVSGNYFVDALYRSLTAGWAAEASADVSRPATVADNWGTWTGTANGSVTRSTTLTPGTYGATAAAQTPTIAASVTITPSTYVATAAAQAPTPKTTVTLAPTAYVATAAAQAPILKASALVTPTTYTATAAAQAPTITSASSLTLTPSTYTATAAAQAPTFKTAVTITPATYVATAAAQAPTVFRVNPATVTTNWGTWTATAAVTVEHPATVTTNWGTWATSPAALVEHPATITTNWATWTATANASALEHPATITDNWGTWSAFAAAIPLVTATISDVWSWTATATATRDTAAAIADNWGTWTATSAATPSHSVTVLPTTYTATAAAQAPTPSISRQAAPSTYTATAAVQTPTISTSCTIAASTYVATAAAQAPTVASSATVSPSAYVASAAAQASTIKTTAVIAPSTYVATAAAQAPVFSATRTIAASTYSASAAAQLPTLTASAIVPASTYTSTAAGQLPAPKTTATVAPATYIATAAGQPPGIGAPGIIAVPTYTATAAAQLPILWLNSPASIATNWVTWTATATAVVGHTATIVSNWTTGAQLTELFNGGADGVAISTVNTPYFTFVSGAIEFDTGFTYKVSQSMRVPSSAVAAYGRHDGMNAAAISASIYVRFASVAPAASSIFMVFRDSLNAQSVSLLLSTASRIVAQDSASAPIAATNIATHAVVANNTYRVDVLVNKGAGTGRLQYRICDVNTADTNTPITTPYDSGATLQLNANNIDRIGVGGVVNGSARNGDWNIGIVRTDESRSTFFDAYLYPNLTATATVEHAASIADNWGTWAAFAAAIPLVSGSISDNWGTWTAIANGDVTNSQALAPSTYTATAAAQAPTITSSTTITATTYTATASAQAPVQKTTAGVTPATYTATAAAQPPTPKASASLVTTTYVASAAAQVPALFASAFVTPATYTAVAAAQLPTIGVSASGSIVPNTYTASAAAQAPLFKTAVTIAPSTYTATAAAQTPALFRDNPASITTNWGAWTAFAAATPLVSGSISETWSWTATAAATVSHFATISTTWVTWTATATATTLSGSLTWTGSITAVGVAGTSGNFAGGATTWTGSVADTGVSGISGAFLPGAVLWSGSLTEIGVEGLSSLFLGGDVTWAGSLADLGVAGLSGLLQGGAAIWVGTLGTVGVIGISGSFSTGIEGQWEGQYFNAMMYESKDVVEWLLIPA